MKLNKDKIYKYKSVRENMEKDGVLVFFVLLISIISVISFVSAECTDPDNGINYYSKASAKDSNQTITDVCVADNPKQLSEAYCENGVANSIAYDCPNGCSEGVCLCPTTTCSGGIIYGPEKCSVNDNVCVCPSCPATRPAICSAMPTCDGAKDTGQRDSNGCPVYSCQATLACSDSDNGKDYYNKGTTKGLYWQDTINKGPLYYYDSCSGCDDNMQNCKYVSEYICREDGKVDLLEYFCQNTCKDGACISSTTTIRCSDTDGGLNYYEKGSTMWGSDISSIDSCEADGITLREEGCVINPGPNQGTMLTNFYKCPNGCKDGACIRGEKQREEVKCIFKGTETQQKCYRAEYNWMYCSSYQGTCIVTNLEGYDGEKITWKSSCGGYAYTVLDGNNEQIEFDCSGATGNFCQSAQCDDGSWSKCYVDGSGYCVCSTCPQIIVKPVCGNGVCESGEGEICMVSISACEAGKECKASSRQCKTTCPGDCKETEAIYTKLNEKFKLQVNQAVKITDYKDMKIIFRDLITSKCEAGVTNVQEVKAKLTAYAVSETPTESIETSTEPIEIIKCANVGPMAQLEVISEEQGNKILTLKLKEAKNIYDVGVSFLDYDFSSRTGVFVVNSQTSTCPVNCICDSESYVIECKNKTNCKEKEMLCPDGICREKCEEVAIANCDYGCQYNNKCLPIGVRVKGMYCNIEGVTSSQLAADEICENNFECSSNVCVSGKCISSGLIQKVLSWFKKMFGG